jgi:hypothetical protein
MFGKCLASKRAFRAKGTTILRNTKGLVPSHAISIAHPAPTAAVRKQGQAGTKVQTVVRTGYSRFLFSFIGGFSKPLIYGKQNTDIG